MRHAGLLGARRSLLWAMIVALSLAGTPDAGAQADAAPCRRWAAQLARKAATGVDAAPAPPGCVLDRYGMARMAHTGELLERRPAAAGPAAPEQEDARGTWPAIRARSVLIGGVAGLTVGNSLASWLAPVNPRVSSFAALVGGSLGVAGTLWLSARSRKSETLIPTVAALSMVGGVGALYAAGVGRWWLDESAGLPFGLGAMVGATAAAFVDERFKPRPGALLMFSGASLWSGLIAKQWVELGTNSDGIRIATVMGAGIGGGLLAMWLDPDRGGAIAIGGTAGGLVGMFAGGLATDGESFDNPTAEAIALETVLVALGMAAGAALALKSIPASRRGRRRLGIGPLLDSAGNVAGLTMMGAAW